MQSTEAISSIAVLSDGHVSPIPGDPSFHQFLETVSILLDQVEHLVLLGDVFQVWAAAPPFDHANGRALLKLIDERGPGRVSLVEGNWDFYLKQRYGDHFARCSEHAIQLSVGGSQTVFVHGHQFTGFRDGLLVRMLKWAPVRYLFRRGWLKGAAGRLNRSFQEGAYSVKLRPDELPVICGRILKSYPRSDRVFCGHFHQAFTCGRICGLPDYHSTGTFWLSTPSEGLYRMEGGKPVPADDIDWLTIPAQ